MSPPRSLRKMIVFSLMILSVQCLNANKGLIVGLNKYSHDASCCIIDASNGKILFAQAKERITCKKHDGGAVGSLLRYALGSIGATRDDITTVVSNCHHYRVQPFEKNIPYYTALNYVSKDYEDLDNLLVGKKHSELSHHLAHAWSCVATAPFSSGLIVVMDGMGESFRAMAEDMGGLETSEYMHDLKLLKAYGADSFVGVPAAMRSGSGYREGESAYVFDGTTLRPVFKRWTRQISPPELYNGGFEDMETLGSVYSRISSHIFEDWNSCGKVMGLAPWANKKSIDAKNWIFSSQDQTKQSKLNLGSDFYHQSTFMAGNPYDEESFKVDWDTLKGLGIPNQISDSNFGLQASIADSVQKNLESSAMSLLVSLKKATGQANIALAGGVALNSVLNGKIARELGFKSCYIPPAPGDEGIAVGCALYGYHQQQVAEATAARATSPPTLPRIHFSAYQGKEFSEVDFDDAINELLPWLEAEEYETEDEMIARAVSVLGDEKGVIAWFQGRSEFGQRALGSRSLLADPRREELRRFLNEKVKEREWFRPLAPSCLAENAGDWFEGLTNGGNESPYMSITTNIKKEKQSEVPAVCHIDGSARLQTVTADDNPLYHKLIEAFKKKTGIPMVLNTSFNRKKQPIVETPLEAIQTFLQCKGSVSSLFMGKWEIKRKKFPLKSRNDETPSQEEGNLIIYGQPFYLSERIADSQEPDHPFKVRIQDGMGAGIDDSETAWRELPSVLHLDLLQLLQADDDSQGGDLALADLLDIVLELKQEDKLGWTNIYDALEWLYDENLVHFDEGTFVKKESEKKLLSELFKGANITDLRDS